MIQTSSDVLLIVLSVCFVVLTLFLTWGVFYVVMILKKVNIVVGMLTKTIGKIDELVDFIHDKVGKGIDLISLGISGVAKIIEYVDKKNKTTAKKRK